MGREVLYGAVQWFDDKPILDGMKYFKTEEGCLAYIESLPVFDEFKTRFTIIRLHAGQQEVDK